MKPTTMQHDLFVNPIRANRRTYPLLVVMYADAVTLERSLVAPLTQAIPSRRALPNAVLPVVSFEAQQYTLVLPLLATIPGSQLKARVGSIAEWRDDITRGLDYLLRGV